MARPLRIDRAGVWHHVTGRGVERRKIYQDDRDRQRWLERLVEAQGMYGWKVHGYAMMENHYHLLLETTEANLSRSMQWFQTSYSMGYNHRYQRVGPLFQGRFQAHVIDPVGWGLEVSRYVHLNPVRVARLGLDKKARAADRLGIRGRPETERVRERLAYLRSFRWSSYRAYVGLEPAPAWLHASSILELGGGRTGSDAQKRYRRYVEEALREGLARSPWEQLQDRWVLGSQEFVAKARTWVKDPDREQRPHRAAVRLKWGDVVRVVEEWRGEKWGVFRDRHGDWGRELAFCLGRRCGGLSLRELGEAGGGVDYAAVSGAIQRFESRMRQEPSIQQTFDQLSRRLLNVET